MSNYNPPHLKCFVQSFIGDQLKVNSWPKRTHNNSEHSDLIDTLRQVCQQNHSHKIHIQLSIMQSSKHQAFDMNIFKILTDKPGEGIDINVHQNKWNPLTKAGTFDHISICIYAIKLLNWTFGTGTCNSIHIQSLLKSMDSVCTLQPLPKTKSV